MTRKRATIIHLALSTALAFLVICLMALVWYPPPLFEVLGGYGLLLLIAGVDIVLGPLLTCIVFKQNQKLFLLDISIIAACQIAALGYGLYTIAEVRPVYIVFVKDRFELVRAFEPTEKNYAAARPEHRSPPWTGPKLVGINFPESNAETMEIMESAMQGGPDFHLLPKYYAAFEDSKAAVMAKARPLETLKKFNAKEDHKRIDQIPQSLGIAPDEIGFLPFRAVREDLSVLVNSKTGDVLKVVKLLPW